MKKTWKERLYDISCSRFVTRYFPLLYPGLALLCFICVFISPFLSDSENLPVILLYSALILPLVGMGFEAIFNAVQKYNKETFLSNKIGNLLLANEWVASVCMYTLIMYPLFMLAIDIVFDDAYILRVSNMIGGMLAAIFSIAISKPISKCFKNKLVYVEIENNTLKEN